MVFSSKAKEEFDVKSITSKEMDSFIDRCISIYKGVPYWLNETDGIKTVNFARFVCSETAKLATLGMSIKMEGDSPRFVDIQKRIDKAKQNFRNWVEYAAAYGTVVLKPTADSVECVLPNKYMITDISDGNITGIVFIDTETSSNGKEYYTRLEYHRWVDDIYVVTNRCFKGSSQNDLGKNIDIKATPWSYLEEEIGIINLDTPLFGVLRMPGANNIDDDSPVSMPVYSDALEELRDLDVAYSRHIEEIDDSRKIVLLDADRLVPHRGQANNPASWDYVREQMGLPHYVRNVAGDDSSDFYQEITPSLNTDTRLSGINSLLSQIGFKCGFSNGYFVFNESTGFATATQVTSDQARTIQLINDIRHNIDVCIIGLVKAINVYEDLYGESKHIDITDTINTDELDRMIHVHFEPIYTNAEEDRQRALSLTNSGYYPKWYYLHKYEGLSEDEARALTEEAMPKEQGLFDE